MQIPLWLPGARPHQHTQPRHPQTQRHSGHESVERHTPLNMVDDGSESHDEPELPRRQEILTGDIPLRVRKLITALVNRIIESHVLLLAMRSSNTCRRLPLTRRPVPAPCALRGLQGSEQSGPKAVNMTSSPSNQVKILRNAFGSLKRPLISLCIE